MKIYLDLKPMTFEEENNEIEHQIINGAREDEYYGYDKVIDLPEDDSFIKKTRHIIYKRNIITGKNEGIDYIQYVTKEQKTWWNFPLYELKNGEIIDFDYSQYDYFSNTERRVTLGNKITKQYNIPSELKILRKAIEQIIGHLDIKNSKNFEAFNKYNQKVENIIKKYPKN